MNVTYKINGRTVTPRAFAARSRKRIALHGGIAEICRSGSAPTADTDETHARINRSGLSQQERALIARRAKAAGMNEHVAYDPTLPPGHQLYETRRQADAAIANDRAKANAREGKPKHRMHPRLVRDIASHMVEENPSLKSRDKRELVEQIIDNHAAPE